ncbi:MAG: integrase [Pseudomonadota bacterium]
MQEIAPKLTAGQLINQLPANVYKTVQKISPCGSLQVLKQLAGVQFFWRYSIGTTSERVSLGLYDSSAPPKSTAPTAKGLSVVAAVRAAEALAIEHRDNRKVGGRPAILEAKRLAAEHEAELEQRRLQERAERDAAVVTQTLECLMEDYADHLEKLGRSSHADVRSITKNHIVEPWPKIASSAAREISTEQIADIMRRVANLGKGRTANKLRSYVRSAYQVARSAKSKANVDEKFKRFDIRTNPAADTDPDESQNRADKRPLTLEELRIFWRRIELMPDFKGAALRLYMLTGGQRLEQLVRTERGRSPAGSLLLLDGKGRPGKEPRLHYVPLIQAAEKALEDTGTKGKYIFTTDGGKTHLSASTLSDWAREAAEGIEGFQTKRIRSGIETELARARVGKEDRGRLQSHGISGVQARHYDAYDYLAEKREALERMYSLLTGS